MPLKTIPTSLQATQALLRSDFLVQWYNRSSLKFVLAVPVIMMIVWKNSSGKMSGSLILSTCITVGLTAIGLMGYAATLAKDRDRGVFRRLRLTPVPAWCVISSRLLVQLSMIVLLTLITFLFGSLVNHITLTPAAYITGLCTAVLGGALYLSLGQMIASFLKNAESVNAATKAVYFVFVMVGMVGQSGWLGQGMKNVIQWSPFGSVNMLLTAGMHPAAWNGTANLAMVITLVYTAVFTITGIRKFRYVN